MTLRTSSRLIVAAVVAAWAIVGGVGRAPAAQTAPNTTISNTSSATYQDTNSNNYNANSNTVSIVVQNAPSMTVTAGSNQTIAPGQSVTDTFTIQNTGNASGNVQLSAAGVTGGTDSASATVTYSFNATPYSTLTALNTALNLVGNAVAVNATISISEIYVLASTATAPGDVQSNATGTIAYAAIGSAPAVTSASATASTAEDDSVKTDARLDLQLSSAQNGTTGALTYTLSAADGTGTWGTKDLTAVKDLLGTSSSGVFISTKIPQYPANTPLTVSGNASVTTSPTNGFATGATAAIYYTASTTGASGWTLASGGSIPGGAYYIGVFVSGGSCTINGSSMSGIEICPVASPSSSAGSVPSSAITLTYTVNQSATNGSADAGSTTAIGNSLVGDNASTEHVIAPGITLNSLADGNDTATITTAGEGINNTTSENSPSGASQVTSNQSLAAYALANGPFGNPLATGAFDGSTNDATHDFTAVSFLKSGDVYTTTNVAASYTPTTSSTTSAVVNGINVESTIQNTGNKSDSYAIVATAPAGWTVTLDADSSGSPGAALGGAGTGATSTASNVTVASGSTLNYWAVYNAPSGVTYLSHGVGIVVATSNASGSVHDQTNHLLYAGFVAVTTTALTTTGCPAGMTPTAAAGTVCPGGTISYTIDYRNVVATTDTSSVPIVSFARVVTKAGTLVVTSDGTNGTSLGNNWASYTSGPNAAPVDTTSATTYAFYTGATGGTSVGSTFQANLTRFVATVGGATFQLVPSGYGSGTSQGTITCAVTVK